MPTPELPMQESSPKKEPGLTKEGAWNLVKTYEMKAGAEPGNSEFYTVAAALLKELFSSAEQGAEKRIAISGPPKGVNFWDLHEHRMKVDAEFVNQVTEDQRLFLLINNATESLSDDKLTIETGVDQEGNYIGVKKKP
jgi:hypothetical protein